ATVSRTTMSNTLDARSWAMLLTLSLLWGGSFLFIGVAVAELPPPTVVAVRVGLAALLLGLWLRLAGVPVPTAPAVLGTFAVMGLFNNILPFLLIAWAQTEIGAGLAAIINA